MSRSMRTPRCAAQKENCTSEGTARFGSRAAGRGRRRRARRPEQLLLVSINARELRPAAHAELQKERRQPRLVARGAEHRLGDLACGRRRCSRARGRTARGRRGEGPCRSPRGASPSSPRAAPARGVGARGVSAAMLSSAARQARSSAARRGRPGRARIRARSLRDQGSWGASCERAT